MSGPRSPVGPMLATRAEEPFDRPGWVYEEKYDGYRLLAHRRMGRVKLLTRNLKELEAPQIAHALEALPGGDFILDGELVAFDDKGVSRFQLLQRRSIGEKVDVVLVLFDCLEKDGASMLRLPLADRRKALESILSKNKSPLLCLSRVLKKDGLKAYAYAKKAGWEGIIAKDASSIYEPGRRSIRWLKVKVRKASEFVIGGFTLPAGARLHFGALLVGLYDGKTLRFCGKVGTGFSDRVLLDLLTKMEPLRLPKSPFTPAPKEKGAIWVRPRLVAQVAYTEWTDDGRLRQPVYLGLRTDKKPEECRWSERET